MTAQGKTQHHRGRLYPKRLVEYIQDGVTLLTVSKSGFEDLKYQYKKHFIQEHGDLLFKKGRHFLLIRELTHPSGGQTIPKDKIARIGMLRKLGKTYQFIAETLEISLGTAHKYGSAFSRGS
jgi:hypothetical protein